MLKDSIRIRHAPQLVLAVVSIFLAGVITMGTNEPYARLKHDTQQHKDSAAFVVPKKNIQIFPGVVGPERPSLLPEAPVTSWRKYDYGSNSRLAVLLTDTDSYWIGLVHGLRTIGVPFLITQDYEKALKHKCILVYPSISGAILSPVALRALAAFPRNGGTLIGVNVQGALNETFGFEDILPQRKHYELRIDTAHPMATSFLNIREHVIHLGNPKTGPEPIGTFSYAKLHQKPVAIYDDSTAAITQRSYANGTSYAIGFDIGFFILRAYHGQEEGSTFSYVNQYGPTTDIILRILKNMYVRAEPLAITIGTVPQQKSLVVLLTHDIDYRQSFPNAMAYVDFERSMGIRTTYFVQTKYIQDYNDRIFFDETGIRFLRKIDSLGMEIGSHSVSHTRSFSRLPLGTGKEMYPSYTPYIKTPTLTYYATIFGELRVSKFLLEKFTGRKVISFRPGYLSDPIMLPQELHATGYQFSSSVTANNVLTHLPVRLDDRRGQSSELNLYEFPVTIEDEELPPLNERIAQSVDLARTISRYGGCCVVLIHPNVIGQKLQFEKAFVAAVRDYSWFGSVSDFGMWWAVRSALEVDAAEDGQLVVLTVTSPSKIDGISLTVPNDFQFLNAEPSGMVAHQSGHVVSLNAIGGTFRLKFSRTK
jgi:hypothetical protein